MANKLSKGIGRPIPKIEISLELSPEQGEVLLKTLWSANRIWSPIPARSVRKWTFLRHSEKTQAKAARAKKPKRLCNLSMLSSYFEKGWATLYREQGPRPRTNRLSHFFRGRPRFLVEN